MRDQFSFVLPVQVEAGYHFAMGLYIGGHFAIAPASIPSKPSNSFSFFSRSSCAGDERCSGSDTRIGIDARVHFLQEEPLHPWAGIGLGYEIANTSISSPTSSWTQTVKGFEFLQLQVGADYAIAPSIAIGAFVQFGIGTYSSVSGGTAGFHYSNNTSEPSVHEWLTAGVRGEYTLRL